LDDAPILVAVRGLEPQWISLMRAANTLEHRGNTFSHILVGKVSKFR